MQHTKPKYAGLQMIWPPKVGRLSLHALAMMQAWVYSAGKDLSKRGDRERADCSSYGSHPITSTPKDSIDQERLVCNPYSLQRLICELSTRSCSNHWQGLRSLKRSKTICVSHIRLLPKSGSAICHLRMHELGSFLKRANCITSSQSRINCPVLAHLPHRMEASPMAIKAARNF